MRLKQKYRAYEIKAKINEFLWIYIDVKKIILLFNYKKKMQTNYRANTIVCVIAIIASNIFKIIVKFMRDNV